jgi:hypothetical protein
VTTNLDRENILTGMRALKSLCIKVAKESAHLQTLDLKGRKVTIAWRLDFDSDNLTFDPTVQTIPESGSSGSRTDEDLQALNERIASRLRHLKEYEPWPVVIPEDWLSDEAP